MEMNIWLILLFIPIAHIAYYIVTGFGTVVKWLLKKVMK